ALAHVVFLPSRGDAPRRERPLLRAGVLLPQRLRAEHALPPRPSRAPWPAAPRPGEPPSPLHAALARAVSLPPRGDVRRPERLPLRAGALLSPRPRGGPALPPRPLRVLWPAALL